MVNIVGTNKDKAINLRLQGYSYNEINRKIGVSKSTLSYWLKDIPGLNEIKDKNIQKAKKIWSKNILDYNKKRAKEYLKKRQSEIKLHSQDIKKISKDNLLFLGLGLYLAEGGKTEKSSLKFTNSNPLIIKVMIEFFEKILKISPSSINARIHLYESDKYQETLNYWSTITGIKKDKFWQPQLVISQSSKRTKPIKKLEFGTLHLTVCNAEMNKKMHGWMKGVELQFNVPD